MPNLKALSLATTSGKMGFAMGGGGAKVHYSKTVKTVKRIVKGATVSQSVPRQPRHGRHEVMLSFDTTGETYSRPIRAHAKTLKQKQCESSLIRKT